MGAGSESVPDEKTLADARAFSGRLRRGTNPQGLSASGQGLEEKILYKSDLVKGVKATVFFCSHLPGGREHPQRVSRLEFIYG